MDIDSITDGLACKKALQTFAFDSRGGVRHTGSLCRDVDGIDRWTSSDFSENGNEGEEDVRLEPAGDHMQLNMAQDVRWLIIFFSYFPA